MSTYTPRPAPCGTWGGYTRHERAGEPACDVCLAFVRRRTEASSMAELPGRAWAECLNCRQRIQRCHLGCPWMHQRDGYFQSDCFVLKTAEPDLTTIVARPSGGLTMDLP